MVIGNNTNTEIIIATYPKWFNEFLQPEHSYLMIQIFKSINIPIDNQLIQSTQLYLEKIKGVGSTVDRSGISVYSFSSNWHTFFSVLVYDIETPLLIWNIETLQYLHTELLRIEECLDFMRQLR